MSIETIIRINDGFLFFASIVRRLQFGINAVSFHKDMKKLFHAIITKLDARDLNDNKY